jgi:hypothetical protein
MFHVFRKICKRLPVFHQGLIDLVCTMQCGYGTYMYVFMVSNAAIVNEQNNEGFGINLVQFTYRKYRYRKNILRYNIVGLDIAIPIFR